MARTVRDTVLSTRSARLRLALSGKPYWRMLEQGLHLGYRRRATGGSWIARRRDENGIYHEEKLGRADDLQDADDATILDFTQAQRVARRWWTNQQRLAAGLPADDGPYTVKRAITDYLDDYRRRGAKGAEVIESVVGRNVLPALGELPVHKLTTRRLADWHRSIAERPRYWRSRKGTPPNTAAFDRKDPEAVRRRRASANRVLTYLRAALNHAWRNGMVPSDDAWRRVKPFKSVDAPVIRYLSDDEIPRLLNACAGAFRDLVHAALLTGCRYGELCRLKVADYNPDVAMRAVPMAVIARQLGHADTRMTERHYAHLAPNYVADTIRASFPRLVHFPPTRVVPIRRA
jgi:integrase